VNVKGNGDVLKNVKFNMKNVKREQPILKANSDVFDL